jgi:SPX domain protein involved in polyphosphate accumulation
LKKKYSGEQLKNAFRVQWNSHLKSNREVFTNEFTTPEGLTASVNKRLCSGQGCVNIYVKGKKYFEKTKKHIDNTFSDEHKIEMKEGIVIAKMKTAKISVVKR